MAVLLTRMIFSQYNAACDDFILNKNEMFSLHADGLLLTGTSNESTVWGLLLELPKTDVYEIELVLYFTKNVNVVTIVGEQGWHSGESARLPPMWPGSIPGPGVTCGLSLLLVLVPAPRVFLRVLRFPSLHKNRHS